MRLPANYRPLSFPNTHPAFIGGEFQGNVSGIAPRAHIATYKVCWDDDDDDGGGGCASSDSAAAIDQAVLDGVDVINFSVGGASTRFSSPDDIALLVSDVTRLEQMPASGSPRRTATPAPVPRRSARRPASRGSPRSAPARTTASFTFS